MNCIDGGWQVYRPDEFIMKEGESSDQLYILAKGRAEVRTFVCIHTRSINSREKTCEDL